MTGDQADDAAHADLPLFPLGTVLVPGLVLPLHIFEPRYRGLVRDLMALPETDRVFGVVAIREGHEVGPEAARALYEVGCTARLESVDQHEDGTFDIFTTGERRFVLESVDSTRPLAVGRVHWLPEPAGNDVVALALAVGAAFVRYRDALVAAGVAVASPGELPDDPGVLSYLVTTAAVIDLSERQSLLAAPDTSTRLRDLLALLRRETALAPVLGSIPAGDLARTQTSLN